MKNWNKNVAATNVIAKPINNEEMRLKGFVFSVKTEVNWIAGM